MSSVNSCCNCVILSEFCSRVLPPVEVQSLADRAAPSHQWSPGCLEEALPTPSPVGPGCPSPSTHGMAHTGHPLHQVCKPPGDHRLHPPRCHVLPSQGQGLEVPGQAGNDHPAQMSPDLAAEDHNGHPTSGRPSCEKAHVQASLSLVAMVLQPKPETARTPLAVERINSRVSPAH